MPPVAKIALAFMGAVMVAIAAFAYVSHRSHSNSVAVLTPAAPAAVPPTVPAKTRPGGSKSPTPPAFSLASVLGVAPGPGYVLDTLRAHGYLTPAQLSTMMPGVPIPAGVRLYQASWIDRSTRDAIYEVGQVSPTVFGTQVFATAVYDKSLQDGGRRVTIPGLPASILTLTDPSLTTVHITAAIVARSDFAFIFAAAGPTLSASQEAASTVVSHVAATLPLDHLPLG